MEMSNFEEKVRKVAAMLASSKAVELKGFDFNLEQWANILTNLIVMGQEEKIDEIMMILEEEQDMYLGVDKERSRKLQNAKTRLKQRVEKIKISTLNPTNKK